MSVTLVDSNIILDIVTNDLHWITWSSEALATAANEGIIGINPIIYAEVSIGFEKIEVLEETLPSSIFQRFPLPWEAGFLAGKCFIKYKQQGGKRHSPLPDFYIGAHAAIENFTLLTRDVSRYRTYFPTLKIIAP